LHSWNAPADEREGETKILTVLDGMVKSHQTYLSVPVKDGMALRLLTEATGAKNVVEIGTSTGYSGLWLCLALQKTNGRLTTFEIDHQRASMAREHFREAGVEKMVALIEGDADEQVVKLKGPIDIAFIDADMGGRYGRLCRLSEQTPATREAGRIDPRELKTIFYMEGGGPGVTLKKR
jgi:predicted O-methyltransferase YrrM